MNAEEVQILYAADARFGPVLGVSLVSLLENSRDVARIRVHIMDQGIAPADRERIERVCAEYGRDLPHWIRAEKISRRLRMGVDTDRGSEAQFARIFLSECFGEETERVLYLDGDTMLRGSVAELWRTDLQGKTVGALADPFARAYRRNIGLAPEDVMFNSGVMLIDLRRWREERVEERVTEFIRGKCGYVEKGDQGALNAVLSKDCLCLAPQMNAVTLFYDFTYEEMLRYRKTPVYYGAEEVAAAVSEPLLVHFTSSFLSKRPWMKGCAHPRAGEWLKYREMSPWRDEPLLAEQPTWRVKLMRRLPRGLMLAAAGPLQAYGRPWLYRLRSCLLRRKMRVRRKGERV